MKSSVCCSVYVFFFLETILLFCCLNDIAVTDNPCFCDCS